MNPCRLFHVVKVERGRDVISAQGELIPGQMDLVRAALRCEVAALAARQLQLLVGRLENPQYRITWTAGPESTEPRDGDRVTLVSGPGVTSGTTCTLRDVRLGSPGVGTLAYKTGILEGHSR